MLGAAFFLRAASDNAQIETTTAALGVLSHETSK